MRVLIADDNRLVASALAAMVHSFGHEVVGIAGSGLDAIHLYDQSGPDVVLMDFCMSRLNGATACRMIVSLHPSEKIVMLSGYLSQKDMSSMECGAVARLPKPLKVEDLKRLLDEMKFPPRIEAATPPGNGKKRSIRLDRAPVSSPASS